MDGEAQVAEAVAAEHIRWLAIEKMPSRPNRKSLSSTLAPGASQTETPLPASFRRPVRSR